MDSSLPGGGGEALHEEAEELLAGAEVAVRVEELLDVAVQRHAPAGTENTVKLFP